MFKWSDTALIKTAVRLYRRLILFADKTLQSNLNIFCSSYTFFLQFFGSGFSCYFFVFSIVFFLFLIFVFSMLFFLLRVFLIFSFSILSSSLLAFFSGPSWYLFFWDDAFFLFLSLFNAFLIVCFLSSSHFSFKNCTWK